MKVGILAGGLGTRFAEATKQKPKALIEIGGKPIIWHVMKHYEHFGFSEFVIATGYRKEELVRYFVDYHRTSSNVSVALKTGAVTTHADGDTDWLVHLIDTGPTTMTGGRIKRLAPFMGNETFMLTWCDGLADVDIDSLLAFHRSHGKLATITAVRPPGRFGYLTIDGDNVTGFDEKPEHVDQWINGAFFVLEPGVFDYIDGDETMWEREPMRRLTQAGQVMAYRHHSFWQCMDNPREQEMLEKIWATGKAPWKSWE
jgi:glucose-1-phosphate cytidylyltransferase